MGDSHDPGEAFLDRYFGEEPRSQVDAAEDVLLTSVADLLDEIRDLRAAVERDGVTVEGGNGQTAAHPALAQIRNHSLAVAKLLQSLNGHGQASSAGRDLARKRWSA